ncbi:MAG: acyltransferase family protein [Pseudomonadales bacterium]
MTVSKSVHHSLQYNPQLDGLRAFAALAVFIQHFVAPDNPLISKVPLGDLGVRLFFVLSGFLITAILLKSRYESRQFPAHRLIYNFYSRRFLRLVPVSFLFLSITLPFFPEAREHFLWFYLYGQNILYAIHGEFMFADPLWSLAVEEQFYLLWPMLILFTPKKWILHTVIAVTILGVVSRVGFLMAGMNHFQASMLTPSHFDTLGMGAVLAVLKNQLGGKSAIIASLLRRAFLIGFAILIVVLVAKLLSAPSTVEFILGGFGSGLLFVWVVGRADRHFTGWLGALLEAKPVVYLGKISYGMYVYHFYVPDLCSFLLEKTPYSVPASDLARFLLFSSVAIALATTSWEFMEKPVMKLKSRFV